MLLFEDLRALLIDYKQSPTLKRKTMLDEAVVALEEGIPEHFKSKDALIKFMRKMAYAGTLINYADALRCIEQQDFFDILIDFKMPELFKEQAFKALTEYFEFDPLAPKMRLLKPIDDIPEDIWALFRDAQKEQLRRRGHHALHQFHLDEIVKANPGPEEQLYPLPIQMFGRYNNESVDRIYLSEEATVRFAHRYGVYLLPGGGMLDVSLGRDYHSRLAKMLDEHLEEEHANLWEKAEEVYNSLGKTKCRSCLVNVINTKKGRIDDRLYDALLAEVAQTKYSNADLIKKQIWLIDQAMENNGDSASPLSSEEFRVLCELRAAIQVESFKLTALYEKALHYVEHNTEVVEIEQLGDTRVCGGRQVSHCFLMVGGSLEEWFKQKFDGVGIELGDDLTGSDIVRKTFWEMMSEFKQVKFSHTLIVLQEHIRCLEKGTLDLDHDAIQDRGQCLAACRALSLYAHTLAEQLSLTSTPTPSNSGVVEKSLFQEETTRKKADKKGPKP